MACCSPPTGLHTFYFPGFLLRNVLSQDQNLLKTQPIAVWIIKLPMGLELLMELVAEGMSFGTRALFKHWVACYLMRKRSEP